METGERFSQRAKPLKVEQLQQQVFKCQSDSEMKEPQKVSLSTTVIFYSSSLMECVKR